MIRHALPRRVAAFLLQSAISIAPGDTLDWGHAMLAELRHVQGNWAALLWSLGSAGVLATRLALPDFYKPRPPDHPFGRRSFLKGGFHA